MNDPRIEEIKSVVFRKASTFLKVASLRKKLSEWNILLKGVSKKCHGWCRVINFTNLL